MKQSSLRAFYEGREIQAYKLFGAHVCKESKTEGVRFTTYAPNAISIQVITSFDNWAQDVHFMKRTDENGCYSIFIAGAKAFDMYKYRVQQANGRVVDKMDPYAFYSEMRPQTASIVYDLSCLTYTDQKWMQQRTRNFDQPMSIYELHLGSWKKQKDQEWINYKEIAAELIAYVKKQHFTHIEIMPLNEYPFDGSWGYQASGFFAATARYGTPKDLAFFMNACHKANIGVIIDFVPVHFVRDDYSLSYFDGTPLYEYENEQKALSQWGSHNFNLARNEVRSFLMSAASFWMDVYHVDGIRIDAVSNIIYWEGNSDLGENQEAITFISNLNQYLHQAYPNVMLIAEDSSNYPNVTKGEGLGFDYKWDLGWMNDTLRYLQRDPIHRKYHHHELTFSMSYFYRENFIVEFSHDEVVHGKNTILGKMWGEYEQKFAQLKTLYLYMFTHPGKKLNFMGNELAHFREWDENRECDWELLTYPKHVSFHRYFSKLNQLYVKRDVLNKQEYDPQNFRWIDADNEDYHIYSYMRKNEGTWMIVILNFSPNTYHGYFGVETAGNYHEIINTAQDIYGGSISSLRKIKAIKKEQNYLPYAIEVDVAPFGGCIFECKKCRN